MQPILCKGGYALPIKEGKFTIRDIKVAVDNPNADSRLLLMDNSANMAYPSSSLEYPSKNVSSTYNNSRVVDLRGIGGKDSHLREQFASGLKVVNGLSIGAIENIEAGSIYVYID
jgi:hypothetical protein